MNLIKNQDPSYNQLQDLLNGYRITQVILTLHKNNFFQKTCHNGSSTDDLCRKCGWDRENGRRFINCLESMGLITLENSLVKPSPFAVKYLMSDSPFHQSATIEFEKQLFESWQTLDAVLEKGKRVYATGDKSPTEYEAAMELYLNAMDDAARIRSAELWDMIKPGEKGIMADLGAGSGVYLSSFLKRNRGWRGVFLDLPRVISRSSEAEALKPLSARIDYIGCNLLDNEEDIALPGCSVDLILISNLIHCQSEWETYHILKKATRLLKPDGSILVHDFFSDTGWFGALYDIHMMLNTYNGRVYSVDTVLRMLKKTGISFLKSMDLPSRSTVIAGSKNREKQLLLRP